MLTLIPARGGSKGIPKKNIRNLSGLPLIAYTIMAAQKSKYIDRVIVSTDDIEIADVAIKFGAEIPFLRPKELATDNARAIDNYIFTIEELNKKSKVLINEFAVLQPTSPLRSVEDIDKAIDIFYKKNADSVISVVKTEHPPSWYKEISKEGILRDYFSNEDNALNRQEAKETYLPNGAIYVFKYEALKSNHAYYNSKTYPYIMNQKNSIDIDTILDFEIAQFLINKRE